MARKAEELQQLRDEVLKAGGSLAVVEVGGRYAFCYFVASTSASIGAQSTGSCFLALHHNMGRDGGAQGLPTWPRRQPTIGVL